MKVAVQEDATAALQEAMAQLQRREQEGVKWGKVMAVLAVGAVGGCVFLRVLKAVWRSLLGKLASGGVVISGDDANTKRE